MKYAQVYTECERRDLILERVRRQSESVVYRYSITNNSRGVEGLYTNLVEAYQDIPAMSKVFSPGA